MRHPPIYMRWNLVAFYSVLLFSLFYVLPTNAASVPNILVLNSYNVGYDWSEDEMTGIRREFAKAYPRVEMYIEHLDTKKFHSKSHFPAQANLLESKYSGRKLDVIIAMDNAALEFAKLYRDRISSGTPLVFCGINDYQPAMIAGQKNITGVSEYHDSIGTLELALKLHPKTKDVYVIHDYTDTGLAMRNEVEKGAVRFNGIKLHFMEELPLEGSVEKLKSLSADSLVLMLSYTVEKGGRTFTHKEAASLISNASSVPVYSVYTEQLGNGVVGGRMIKGEIQGETAAKLAIKILNGEFPPIMTSDFSSELFDYKILKKFGIDTKSLPADAVLINSPPSTLAFSKTTVWSATLIFVISTIAIVGMWRNIRKRQVLEEQLRREIDKFQRSQEELQATEEMLKEQVEEYMQNQEELLATEEMLRDQIREYQETHDQLLATEEMLRVQLEAVEESSQKFKAVFDGSPITVALTSLPDGKFIEVNRSFVDMFGFSHDEAIGKSTVELGVWGDESARESYLKILRKNRSVQNFEADMLRKDRTPLTVLFSGSFIEIAGNSCVLSAVMDITEQKKLQSQLLQAQKMDVVGQLAGGIAHDFNNMLTGIMAAAEMLKTRATFDERSMKMVDIIIHAATRSADLTRELLSFSRKGRATTLPVNVHDTIKNAITILERTIDRNIKLVTRFNADSSVVMGDQTQFQSALLNLGLNARDAMPEGGTLTYSTAIKELDEIGCRTVGLNLLPGRYLEISVADSGTGMTKEIMEHIFEPFYTTKGVGKGTGLGLAAVYGFTRNHGGEICVSSQPGVGTVFRIYLPLVEAKENQQTVKGEAVHGSGVVLLVDDEEMLRDIGRELLQELGYTVLLATNGEEALEQYELHRDEIGVVLLDMIMPKMGGKETFIRLKEKNPEIKVVICSGFNLEANGDQMTALNPFAYIQKPYNSIELSQAVAKGMVL